MPNETVPLDRVFQALSNSTRREVIERLGHGPATMTDLAAPYDMALPSFLQHLQVLESAGMVSSEKKGRVRMYQLEAKRLLEAENWMDKHRRQWEARLDQLDSFLLDLKESNKP